MHQDQKIIKQRKQSLTRFQQQTTAFTGGNTVASITRERESSNGRIRSTSTLPKNYNQTLVNNQGSLDRTPSLLGLTTQIKSNVNKQVRPKGAELVGWGQFYLSGDSVTQGESASDTKSTISPRKLASNVIKFSLGEKHIVYVNNKNEAYGIGSSIYGQLGYRHGPGSQTSFLNNNLPILEQLLIEDVFCTPYCSFFITNRDEVYGCGLNNRGQLGIVRPGVQENSSISTPTKILSLSKKSMLTDTLVQNKSQKSTKKLKTTKIQSYALAQRNIQNNLTNQSKLLTQKSQGVNSDLYLHTKFPNQWMSADEGQPDDQTLLDDGQFITYITGGPYHSIALSSKGRVFYSGNIYKKSAIVNDEYTTKFTELNLKKIGKVSKIRSGLSCIGLLNMQGSLFLLGAISENIICDDPYNLGINGIVDFAIAKEKIYVTTGTEAWVIVAHKKSLRTFRANFGDHSHKAKISTIQCGLDYCMMMTEKGIFAEENSNLSSLGIQFTSKITDVPKNQNTASDENEINFTKLNINFKLSEVKCGVNYIMGLSDKFVSQQANIASRQTAKCEESKKIKALQGQNEDFKRRLMQLERQNKILKDLVKDENNESKSHRNNSIKKKDLGASTSLADKQNFSQQLKKSNHNEHVGSSKFDLNNNLGEKIVSKARKFDGSMEIPFEELQLGKQISEGGYGVIYKATWRKTTVAVKIFKIDINSENSIKDFISECHAMEALRHPNIVMFLGACTKPPNFGIVLEYCEGGTLWSILQKNGELSWQLRKRLALDTARAMNYLHERSTPILHRDLKSLNLLLDENKRIKLADFGWTKGLQNYMTGKIGTYQWMAPEVVSSHQYTEKADVFSFAIILWEIASRQAPYRNIPGAQVAQDVLNKDLRPTCPKKTPEAFASLMKRCWAKVPESRPSFSEIIEQLEQMQFND